MASSPSNNQLADCAIKGCGNKAHHWVCLGEHTFVPICTACKNASTGYFKSLGLVEVKLSFSHGNKAD